MSDDSPVQQIAIRMILDYETTEEEVREKLLQSFAQCGYHDIKNLEIRFEVDEDEKVNDQ